VPAGLRRLLAGTAVALGLLAGVGSPALAAGAKSSQLPDLPVPLPIPLPPGSDSGPAPGGYQQDDGKGFRNILPSGQNGLANGPQLAAFLSTGERPPHNSDQLSMYGDLVYATPGLSASDIPKYFKDASFGVKDGDVERRYSPRSDVTIVRDKGFGVPHIYGATRAGAMFGIGYATAEDRLFFIDVLRHLGRAQLSSFAGGAPANRAFDEEQWQVAPYTEKDLEAQINKFPRYGADGVLLDDDLVNYVAGINQYIDEAKLDLTKMPGEYAAIGKPLGPDPWKGTDVVATAALVGAIFGKGGGGELNDAAVLQAAQKRFGLKKGLRVWKDFRSANDPEAPTTVHKATFPYEATPKKIARGSMAIPDRGSFEGLDTESGDTSGTGSSGSSGIGGLLGFPASMSNALVVSGPESQSGHPLAVFGPQTGYFAPQILMEQDVHAPTIDARGAGFPGTNLYVELGRGRDYAWSATSAGQDIIDTFALPLCNPDGSEPTLSSDHYRFHGSCREIERLDRTNSWTPNAADQTPSGSETLHAQRTALGIVAGKGTVRGKPVVYSKLRSTYMHEVDSALGFSDFNNPDKMRTPQDFQNAAYKIGYTFNWLYVDDKHDAYFNSGNNPVRPKGIDTNFPTMGLKRFEWRNFNPADLTADYTPQSAHPQVVDQSYITSWNNKQARGYRAADDNFSFQSVYRSKPLDDGVKTRIRGAKKLSLPGLIDAMEEAGTVDLRGNAVLPWMLRVLGSQKDPQLQDAIAKLTRWQKGGAHRIDKNRDGVYDQSDAVRIMDAWWPLWIHAQFEPVLGKELFDSITKVNEIDNAPNNHGDHLGSAYQAGWYGYALKDLRRIAGKKVKGPYSRVYCGKGKITRCRALLVSTLRQAVNTPASKVYSGDEVCKAEKKDGNQWCYDAVRQRPLGGITQPLIHWINRPTFQQAVEIQSHR
jgi:acyl-homoserine lactone acylase PvdQ